MNTTTTSPDMMIDDAAVATFIGKAAGQPQAMRETVAAKMERMAATNERPFVGATKISKGTMLEVARQRRAK